MHNLTDRIAHITAFDTTVVEHWLEQTISDANITVNRNVSMSLNK